MFQKIKKIGSKLRYFTRNMLSVGKAPHHAPLVDRINALVLPRIKIHKVTVDGNTIFDLHEIHDDLTRSAWHQNSNDNQLLAAARDAVQNVVLIKEQITDCFDFKRIQSMSASKGFDLNGGYRGLDKSASRHTDARAWAQSMYEDENIAFTSDEDFDENLHHFQIEGLGKRERIRIEVFSWHEDRVLWVNSGASHHSAAIIGQMWEQGKSFSCPAEVTLYSLNPSILDPFKPDLFIVLVHLECEDDGCEIELAKWLNAEGIKFSSMSIAMPQPHRTCQILILPKEQQRISEEQLGDWLKSNIENHCAIDFFELISDPQKIFAKHHYNLFAAPTINSG